MKKKYIICYFDYKEVHVPSTDYYARNGESSTEEIQTFSIKETNFDTEGEAQMYLKEYVIPKDHYENGYYLILPAYLKE
jgi:hypothetical protein